MTVDPREAEKQEIALLEGLRAALSSDEARLYRTGKFEGLFAARSGPPGDAAAQALREQLLEHARTEIRGRFEIEWVRLTAKGIEYLYQHDSPRAVLGEMREMLKTTREGVPLWQDEMLKTLELLATNITSEMGRYLSKLDALTKRIDEALRRIEISPEMTANLQAVVSWGLDALTYLDRRKQGGASGTCPLPELFGALRGRHPTLTIREFQLGLSRLHESGALRLTPHTGTIIPQPEYAIMLGGELMYHAER